MKKLVLALTAVAAFTGSAMAADMAPRPYAKAPMPMAVAPSWTGFYIFGGAGGGMWDADSNVQTNLRAVSPSPAISGMGGDGWFGTVGVGYDWQFNSSVGSRRFRRRTIRQPQGLRSSDPIFATSRVAKSSATARRPA